MRLHELYPFPEEYAQRKRVGRGPGSGSGCTSGRGNKGQNSRSGGGRPAWFEGGQMPLARRLPKRGFTNIFAKEYTIINISDLEVFENGTVVTAELLKAERVISKIEKDGLKVLGRGKLTKKLDVKAAKFSKTAQDAIKAAGGSVEVID